MAGPWSEKTRFYASPDMPARRSLRSVAVVAAIDAARRVGVAGVRRGVAAVAVGRGIAVVVSRRIGVAVGRRITVAVAAVPTISAVSVTTVSIAVRAVAIG